MINKDITSYSSMFSKDYTELRVQENRQIMIVLLNGDVVRNDSSSSSGVSSRTFKDGNWGFSSNPNISDESVQSVIKSSTDNLKFLNKKHDNIALQLFVPKSICIKYVVLFFIRDNKFRFYPGCFFKKILQV